MTKYLLVLFNIIIVCYACISSNPNITNNKTEFQAENLITSQPTFTPNVLKGLQFPDKTNIFYISNFLEKNAEIWQQYAPLGEEYSLYYSVFEEEQIQNDDEEALSTRISENLEKTHWVFIEGVKELLEYMGNKNNVFILSDKEKVFLQHMQTLLYLAENLQKYSADPKYVKFAKELYLTINAKYFGQRLDDNSR